MAGYDRFILNTDYDAIKKVGEVQMSISGGNFDLSAGAYKEFNANADASYGVAFEIYSIRVSDSNLGGEVALTGARCVLEHTEAGNNKYYDYNIIIQKGTVAGKYTLRVTIRNQYSGTVHVPQFVVNAKITLYIPASSN